MINEATIGNQSENLIPPSPIPKANKTKRLNDKSRTKTMILYIWNAFLLNFISPYEIKLISISIDKEPKTPYLGIVCTICEMAKTATLVLTARII